MTAPKPHRLKDGRLRGVLTRRLLDALVRKPGQVVSPDVLRPAIWPDGAPTCWRNSLAQTVVNLDATLGGGVIVRHGTKRRLDGFRLLAGRLPSERLSRRAPSRYWRWTADEDRYLADHVGELLLPELTAGVNAIHGRDRRSAAVRERLSLLGISRRDRRWYSANRLAPILGVDGWMIGRWIETGRLRARRMGAAVHKQGNPWRIEPADIEAFIREYPWEYDWRTIRPSHPFALLARTVQGRNPYLTFDQARRHLRIGGSALQRRLQCGLIVGAVRVTPWERSGSPERSMWRIPAAALVGVPADLRKRSVAV